jgi:hypothetical protein
MCTAELDLSYNKRFPDAYVPEAYEKLIHVRYVTLRYRAVAVAVAVTVTLRCWPQPATLPCQACR